MLAGILGWLFSILFNLSGVTLLLYLDGSFARVYAFQDNLSSYQNSPTQYAGKIWFNPTGF